MGDGIYEATEVVEDWGGWAVLLQQWHPNSDGPLVIARRTECNPQLFLLFSLHCWQPCKLGETAKVYREINVHQAPSSMKYIFTFISFLLPGGPGKTALIGSPTQPPLLPEITARNNV